MIVPTRLVTAGNPRMADVRTGEWQTLRFVIGDLGIGEPQEWGPWEWRTPGMGALAMADRNHTKGLPRKRKLSNLLR